MLSTNKYAIFHTSLRSEPRVADLSVAHCIDVAVERRERESEEDEEEGYWKGGHYFPITHDRAEELLSWSRKTPADLQHISPDFPGCVWQREAGRGALHTKLKDQGEQMRS